jgi:hypothetical protein
MMAMGSCTWRVSGILKVNGNVCLGMEELLLYSSVIYTVRKSKNIDQDAERAESWTKILQFCQFAVSVTTDIN